MSNHHLHALAAAGVLAALLPTLHAAAAGPQTIDLKADPQILAEGGDLWGRLAFYNDPVALSPEKPTGSL